MDTQEERGPAPKGERERRPYERPAIRWEEEFEPYAFSSCGKMGGGVCAAHMNS